jgi:hypothetical protein
MEKERGKESERERKIYRGLFVCVLDEQVGYAGWERERERERESKKRERDRKEALREINRERENERGSE